MKKVIFSAALACIALMTQSFTTTTTPSVKPTFGDPVLVQQGTPVMFRLNQNINSQDVEIGNVVYFEVANPVIADGKEVVTQGTIAEGEIIAIDRETGCQQCSDKIQSIEIVVNKVKAVDGKFIYLYGKPMVIRAKCKGCPVQASQGLRLSATVQNTVRIKA